MPYILQLVKGIALGLFVLVSAYIIKFGKAGTGMKLDYVFTSIFLMIVILCL